MLTGAGAGGVSAQSWRSASMASMTIADFSIALTAPPSRQSGWRTSAWPGRPGTLITPYSDPRQAIQT